MTRASWSYQSFLWPDDAEFPVEKRSAVLLHRLLSLIGAVLMGLAGCLLAAVDPSAVDLLSFFGGGGGVFLGLLGASYVSGVVRYWHPEWMRGVAYVLMVGLGTIAALNGFSADYDVGLLLLYGTLPCVVALGAESNRPVWRFLGIGILASVSGTIFGLIPPPEALVLTGGMAAVASVEGIALSGQFFVRGRLERQNDLFARAQRLADIGAWEYGVFSEELFWTQQVRKIHGLPPDYEPTVDEAVSFYHPDDQSLIEEILDRAVEKGIPFDEELRLKHEHTGDRWVRARGTPQMEDGEVARIRGTFQDITERKTQQQRLQSLRERLELAIGGAGLGTWDWDIETDEVIFNQQWAEMLGYSLEELDFRFEIWEELVHPDDLSAAAEALDAHLAGTTDFYQQELRMRTKGGDWKWIRAVGRAVERDAQGTPTRAAGIHLDIDERKRDKQKLRARSAAMETSIDGMAILGPDETYRFVNQAHADIYGYESPDAFLENTWRMCYEESEQTRLEERAFPVLRAEGSWRGEALGQRRDGTTFPQEVSLTLAQEGHIVGIVRDITGRKAQERELREIAGEYETTLDNVTDAIFLADVVGTGPKAEFRFERLSSSYEAMTGLTTEEVRGKTPSEVLGAGPGGELTANFHRCVETKTPVTYEEEIAMGREVRMWQTSLAPVLVGGKVERIVGVGRDITKRVEREQELERKNARLDSFAGLVSHDLRNPLNVATGRLQLAQEEEAPDPDHLVAVERALERMDAIIEDVLALTWGGRDIRAEELSTFSLASLAETSWDHVDTSKATLHFDDPPRVRCDEDRLRRLLENLFRNAVEHGGETVSVEVGRCPGGFYVEDDGTGFPEGKNEAVFEAGYSSGDEGTGLGLSIVESIAEAHGGTLSATNGRAGGARFEVTGIDVEAPGEENT
ncbi:PAS domain S-box protein [Salinibacter grassmerensis]|uniref:PAS domain-containing sensor histidine kinase n=1 Tax=Salinibacter grassmerensis TaxID=3040353 RepID=UPI0021E954FB|nr:PAS domain S-box protein [Salinibacter grassmerensis]